MGLLPTPHGLADFPLPGVRTLIISDIPRNILRRIARERLSFAGPLEELEEHVMFIQMIDTIKLRCIIVLIV